MSRQKLFTVAIAFAVAGLPMSGLAAAQERTSNGNTTGSAVPRSDGGGGSAAPRDSGGGGSVSGGTSSGDVSSGSSVGNTGWTAPSSSSSIPSTMGSNQPPVRYGEQSGRTRSSGSTTSGTATPRSSGGSAPRGESSTSSGSGSSGRTASSGSSESGSSRRAVPAYSRPRGDRPVTGEAVDRGSVPPAGGGGGGIHYPYYPYYPWGFWGPGYGFGLGYLYYDPFWGGYGYGYGHPGGYYGGGGGGGGYSLSQSSSSETGAVRLKIKQKQAEIYVDGYYVGLVDSYDGSFQKLTLDSGGHKLELKADGYEPLQFDVVIAPGETVTYKGELKRIQ